MPKLIILQGIPCSGKDTWIRSMSLKDRLEYTVISRDDLRMYLLPINGKYNDYKFSKENEDWVTRKFNEKFDFALKYDDNIILNNTNLKYHYLLLYIEKAKAKGYEVEFKRFPISLWKAQLRNIVRWMKEGKYIPFKVMKDMYKNYKRLK